MRGAGPGRARPTCSSTTGSPSTCPAATWRCAARRWWRSAASIPSTCAPATTWTSAGGCRRAGGTIGFAPAALVWHHHRPSIGAFWRQQVGYGEGEVWLQPHHPDKFVGSRIQWRGHVYSPLPFVRALFDTCVNAGPWGTAPFPSVYKVGASPLRFAPHSPAWLLAATGAGRGRDRPGQHQRRPARGHGGDGRRAGPGGDLRPVPAPRRRVRHPFAAAAAGAVGGSLAAADAPAHRVAARPAAARPGPRPAARRADVAGVRARPRSVGAARRPGIRSPACVRWRRSAGRC